MSRHTSSKPADELSRERLAAILLWCERPAAAAWTGHVAIRAVAAGPRAACACLR